MARPAGWASATAVPVIATVVPAVAPAAVVVTAAEHLQLATELLEHDLGRIPLYAVLLPLPGLKLALDVDLGTLLQILLRDLGEVVVINDDLMPLGLFLPIARVLVAPRLRCCDAKIDHRIAAAHAADFRVGAQIPHQNYLVD